MPPSLRIPLFALAATGALVTLLFACTDQTVDRPTGPNGSLDGSTKKADGATGEPGEDPEPDAGDTEPEPIEDGPGEEGAECAFNRDCKAALRCECSEATGCACAPGARGTGKNGVDVCQSGNDCASSLCVEGPEPGESICSDACKTDDDCTGKLPQCLPITGLPEPICTREPPP